MSIYDCVVTKREQLKNDIIILTLASSGNMELPQWSPGAHISVILPNKEERQYSLCGDTEIRNKWRIAVKRLQDGKGGSQFIFQYGVSGAHLKIRDPINTFILRPSEKYLFIAGGIGITPILPMLKAVEAKEKEWKLLYLGKHREMMPFVDELGKYGEKVIIHESKIAGRFIVSTINDIADKQTEIYCCGPIGLMDAIEAQNCLLKANWQYHFERFAPKEKAYRPNQAFLVKIASTGQIIEVDKTETIAEALERNGVEVLTSCREGTCGTCLTSVLEGIPEHRDSVLTDEEKNSNELIMVCCSRALSASLTLDL